MRGEMHNNFTGVRKHVKNVILLSITLALSLAATFLWEPIAENPMPRLLSGFCFTYSAVATGAIISNAVDISKKKSTPPSSKK